MLDRLPVSGLPGVPLSPSPAAPADAGIAGADIAGNCARAFPTDHSSKLQSTLFHMQTTDIFFRVAVDTFPAGHLSPSIEGSAFFSMKNRLSAVALSMPQPARSAF
ncbi:hypothetical protein D9619_001737 [Psilocybe cf. subviscida]|uniref:Uncharacterized protein n=1 Tax=Psilocybe cf. subviscida TaxID=2480587 RepID=A0A8H5F3Y3_9AGAR|nr:hypothetical protein D9619_001737 [Psilocybe cf. subviscida]